MKKGASRKVKIITAHLLLLVGLFFSTTGMLDVDGFSKAIRPVATTTKGRE